MKMKKPKPKIRQKAFKHIRKGQVKAFIAKLFSLHRV